MQAVKEPAELVKGVKHQSWLFNCSVLYNDNEQSIAVLSSKLTYSWLEYLHVQ